MIGAVPGTCVTNPAGVILPFVLKVTEPLFGIPG